MRIVITGDTHGDLKLTKFKKINKEYKNIDYVIVCGDFGYLFDGGVFEKRALLEMENFPFKILWCDGNHENFELLKMFPVKKWNGGNITKINNNVYHLKRGEIYILENKKFFVFGGALSPDKHMRTEFFNYWEDEIPTVKEMDFAINNLNDNNNKIDYIVSHTCSTTTLNKLMKNRFIFNDPTSVFLQHVKENTSYDKWFFGHLHLDEVVLGKEYVVYNDFKLLEI